MRVWFRVAPEAVPPVLVALAKLVATNYCGHPFDLLIEDTGDGGIIGPVGNLTLCFRSWRRGERAYKDADKLAADIRRETER